MCLADDPRRNPDNRRLGQHRRDNHTAGPDLCAHAKLDIAEDLRARANQQAGVDFTRNLL
jgi:hypothetical protein